MVCKKATQVRCQPLLVDALPVHQQAEMRAISVRLHGRKRFAATETSRFRRPLATNRGEIALCRELFELPGGRSWPSMSTLVSSNAHAI
jgi:hypothetical protein